MPESVLQEIEDHLLEHGIGIYSDPPELIFQDNGAEIERAGHERDNVFRVQPLGAREPDVLVILGEPDHGADRFGGFSLMLDKIQELRVFCKVPGQLDVPTKDGELVEDIVPRDAVEQLYLLVCEEKGLFCMPWLGHVRAVPGNPDHGAVLVKNRPGAPGYPDPFAILCYMLRFPDRRAIRLCANGRAPMLHLLHRIRTAHNEGGVCEGPAEQLIPAEPEVLHRIFIDKGDSGVFVQADDQEAGMLDQLAVPGLARPEGGNVPVAADREPDPPRNPGILAGEIGGPYLAEVRAGRDRIVFAAVPTGIGDQDERDRVLFPHGSKERDAVHVGQGDVCNHGIVRVRGENREGNTAGGGRPGTDIACGFQRCRCRDELRLITADTQDRDHAPVPPLVFRG